jgi:cbb3-type cytochrome oxidase maturation protein
MEILYLLIPLSLVLVFVIAVIFWRSLKGGQFDDLEGPGYRVLMDDDSPVAGEKIGSVDLDQRKTPSGQ